jgi:hypothetical protein
LSPRGKGREPDSDRRLTGRKTEFAQTMDPRTMWIDKGTPLRDMQAPGDVGVEDQLIHRDGLVKISTSEEQGTTITWAFFAPNWSSLYFIMETLFLHPAPYHLHYFLAGWFSETIPDWRSARNRLNELVSKSDVHLTTRTFVKEMEPDATKMPQTLQDVWSEKSVRPDISVDCVLDPDEDRFKVIRIGPNSQIARLWGVMPVTYPCLNGGSYDQIVSAIYGKVIETGESHYGHVYAAMSFPNRQVRWFPYQRVVLPHKFPDGRNGVTVVSEFSPVDIRVV